MCVISNAFPLWRVIHFYYFSFSFFSFRFSASQATSSVFCIRYSILDCSLEKSRIIYCHITWNPSTKSMNSQQLNLMLPNLVNQKEFRSSFLMCHPASSLFVNTYSEDENISWEFHGICSIFGTVFVVKFN